MNHRLTWMGLSRCWMKRNACMSGSPLPDFRPISAMKARIWVAQGRLTKALTWAREQGLSPDNDLSYLREFEHITLARILIAQYQNDRMDGSIHAVLQLLDRLLQAAQEGGRMGSVIEILVLQALAYQAQGNITSALAPLERALTLAEPEGYIRIFVDKGKPMAELLARIDAERRNTPRKGVHLSNCFLLLICTKRFLPPLPLCAAPRWRKTGLHSLRSKQSAHNL